MRGERKRCRRAALASTLMMVAIGTAACGTTVSTSDIPPATQAGSSGLTVGASPGAVRGGPGITGAGTARVPGTTFDAGAPGAVSAVGSASSVGAAPANGHVGASGGSSGAGTALGPIKIGNLTVQGAAAAQRAAGFSHGASGDQIAMTQSIVDYINAHGGLGGRKIQVVSYDLNTAAVAADPNSALQAACAYFTQDHPVVAIASYVGLAPQSFYQCLAKAHVPIVTPDEGVSSDFMHRYANTVYMPAEPTYTRLLADSVDALWNAGWLTAKSTIGVVGYDTTDVHAIVDKGLVPALQRHGLKLTAELYTSSTDNQDASRYNGGVFSFRSKHVDRVFFAPGGQPVYFALAAEQEAYHPRYELGSLEYPNPLAQTVPADQLAGSMGLGWLPYFDLPSSKWPTVTPPGIAECRKALATSGQDLSSGNNLGEAAWFCDDWMLLRDAFNAGASPDEVGIRRAIESLGEAFTPASTFRTTLAVGRTHDGASGYRLIAFNDTCKCYLYNSPVRPLP